jgi:deoxyadenosine/deoxycytidine kinase
MHMQTKLILVEGVPFTGKSTLSEYVAQQLGLNGHASEWVYEGVMLNKHFPHVKAVLDQTQPISEESLWADWSAFVQTVNSASATFVVDAAISYAAVYPLLAEDRPYDEILALVTRIAELCAPLHPRVIHLMGDAEQLARASIVERGDQWEKQLADQSDSAPYQKARGRSGVEGAIVFFDETQEIIDEVLEASGWQTLTLNVTSSDREANRQAVLSFLGIDEVKVEPPALAAPLQAYTGTYAEEEPDGPIQTFEVRIEEDGLTLHQPGMRLGRLVPVSATRFHLKSAPVDVELVVEEGIARRLVLHTSSGRAIAFRRV